MKFNDHRRLEGSHSFLSPSNYHWVGYSFEKLRTVYLNSLAKERGVKLHAFAKDAILYGEKLAKSKKALNQFVNDAIGYRMTPEQVLYFSQNCFGTADAISYRNKTLRIHDLKTGDTKASFVQLEIYAALFFLEYKEFSPEETNIELRIYQGTEVLIENPDICTIRSIMTQIVEFDQEIEKIKATL